MPTNSVLGHEHASAGHFPRNVNMGFRGGNECHYSGTVFRVALADDAIEYASCCSAHD